MLQKQLQSEQTKERRLKCLGNKNSRGPNTLNFKPYWAKLSLFGQGTVMEETPSYLIPIAQGFFSQG